MASAPEEKQHFDVPLSESIIEKIKEATAQECIEDLRSIALENPEQVISRNFYRVNGKYAESAWSAHYGTFSEFKRQSGIVLSRQQHNQEKAVARHASVDHYRVLSKERENYAGKYDRADNKRFKTIIVASDLHDKECDPFFLRVFVDTAKRIQPDVIVLNGDVWDAPEFGRYTVDPRTWDVVGRIKFIHEKILSPLREACSNTQIDWIAGNHEDRLCKHLADATPAMRSVLSDLHGFTIGSLMGLDKYEVNFIAKSDLAAYSMTNIKSEVQKNYKVYYGCYVTNHFADGVKLGMPGTNGHSHKFKVTPCYNEMFGSYSWIQTGCGHILDASYCSGEQWDMGFLIVHIDTEKKQVNQEYVPVSDFSVVGGKYYYRDTSELTHICC